MTFMQQPKALDFKKRLQVDAELVQAQRHVGVVGLMI